MSLLRDAHLLEEEIPTGTTVTIDKLSLKNTLHTKLHVQEQRVADMKIYVLSKDRAVSLQRLLDSLENTDYSGDTVQIFVHIDHSPKNADSIAVARDYKFSWGNFSYSVSSKGKGLRDSWFHVWHPQNYERAVILEDDIKLSREWYKWLKLAWESYGDRTDLAGISLQRQTLVPKHPSHHSEIENEHKPFLYALVGSIGFSPHWKQWRSFQEWIASVDIETVDLKIPELITTNWFYLGRRNVMWTQYFIWFCKQHDLYTLYVNLPGKTTLAAHMREKGEHHNGNDGQDFTVAVNVHTTFPDVLYKYGWDAKHIVSEVLSPVKHVAAPQTTARGMRFSPLELECINTAAGVYSMQTPENSQLSNTILVTASNYAYLRILRNWEYFAGKHGYKWLVVAMDVDLWKVLGPSKSVMINTPENKHYHRESHYRSPGFNSISIQKLVIVRDLLRIGYNVIFCDPDNIFLRDIFRADTDLMRMIRSDRIDYVYSVNTLGVDAKTLNSCEHTAEYEGNTGFYYVSCKNIHSLVLFDDAIASSVALPLLDDQPIFWNQLRKMKNRQHCHKTRQNNTLSLFHSDVEPVKTNSSTFTYCCMDPRKVVTGKDVRNDRNVEAYHANWAIGIQQKIAKLKNNVYGGGWILPSM